MCSNMNNESNHSIRYKAYRKYKKMTTTIGTCKECETNNTTLVVKEKFCTERCYDRWKNKQSRTKSSIACGYKFCDNEAEPKYNGRYCSKICRNAQLRDNEARKEMMEEGIPIDVADRRIKRTPVDKANYMFGNMVQAEERRKRSKHRERRNSENAIVNPIKMKEDPSIYT